MNQNVYGIVRAWKFEAIIKNMINNNIDAYTIQETWLKEDIEKVLFALNNVK